MLLKSKVLGLLPDHAEDYGQIIRIRRITGYLVSSIDRWNSAKKAELFARIRHK